MKTLFYLTLLCSSVASAAAPKTIAARHLDPTVMPTRLIIDGDVLVVDGTPVRGSLKKQFDYLEIVLARDASIDASELGFTQRRRALLRKNVGVGVVCSAGTVGSLLSAIAVPPLAGVAVLISLEAGGLALIFTGRRHYELSALGDRIDRYGMTGAGHGSRLP